MKGYKGSQLDIWQKKAHNGTEKCAKCSDTRNLTVDHIVPIFIIDQFILGKEAILNKDENFQILCRYCNQMKSAQIDPKNPVTYSVMRKILDEAEDYYFNK